MFWLIHDYVVMGIIFQLFSLILGCSPIMCTTMGVTNLVPVGRFVSCLRLLFSS